MKKLYWIILVIIAVAAIYYFGFAKNYGQVSVDVNLGKAFNIVRVVSPNGGENLRLKDVRNIQWETSNVPSNSQGIRLFLKKGEATLGRIGSSDFSIGLNSQPWEVGSYFEFYTDSFLWVDAGDDYRIAAMIIDSNGQGTYSDDSDGFFSITSFEEKEPERWFWRWW